ncbi:MAG: lipopolysaccharide biosynthesis protein [Alphaproteobacteria bacterium]|nr:lipopolysaccharide biosynthesis protein [Alphaproteobacteria bacterium]
MAARILDKATQILKGADGQSEAQRMSLIAFAIRIVGAGIAFLSQIILARLMGPFEYGIFVFVWVMAIIVGNLSCLGFHTAVIRFLPQYRAHGEIAHIRGITVTARLVALLSATALAATGMGVLYLFGDRIGGYYVIPLFLGAFALPMIALGDVLDGTARANNWPVQALSPTYLVRPVLILAVTVSALLIGYGASATTALSAALIATYLTTVSQLFLLGWRLRKRYEAGPRKIRFGYWVTISLPIFLIEGFYFLLTNSDVIMVGIFLEPDQVATYFAAAKTMALVHFVYFAIKAGMTPRFSALVAEDQRHELAVFAANTARWTFWPSLALGGAVLALGPFLLSLFGPEFGAGYPLMFILFAGILAKAFIGPGEALLTMAGEQKICALVYFIALVVNISGNLLLIPILGLTGAAVATMLAMTVEAALLFTVIRKRLNITMSILSRPNGKTLPQGAD